MCLNNYEFTKTKTGDYSYKQHSQTLNNEKKIINTMTEDLADEILDELKKGQMIIKVIY